jgi:molybdopterin converting factor small subunit
MNIHVRIPTVLRKLTGGAEKVLGRGATVAAVLKDIELHNSGIAEGPCN